MYIYDSWENPLLATYPYTFNNYSSQSCSNIDIINQCQTQQLRNNDNLWNLQKIIDCCCQQNLTPLTQQNEIQADSSLTFSVKEESENKEFESIKDYMNKEFLYESELKEIENGFHFNFKNLGIDIINEKNRIYKISKKIIEDLQSKNYVKNLRYIRKVDIREYPSISNSADIYYNDESISYYIGDTDANKKDEEDIKNMCNTILKQDIQEYKQFYEKYKNRIVKDNEYEDLSYYEKILKEVE